MRILAVTGVLACCALPLGAMAQVTASFLQPMGPVAEEQANHLLRVVGITMIVILPVLVGVPLILWRYRYAAPKGDYAPRWEFSKPLEFVLWGVPVLVVAMLAVWLWHSTAKLDPYRANGADPLRVQAVGLDWKWVFIYPDLGIATVDELAVPVGRPVRLTLTTDTVMQSLLIAPLTGQVYAMPGMTTRLDFSATRPGTAEGENTQFNGTGFGRQKFAVRALAPQDFARWSAQEKTGPALDEATYALLRRRSVLVDARQDLGLERAGGPLMMALARPDAFDAIVAKYHAGGSASATWGGIGLPARTTGKHP
ncbi:cytochrome c oxidase subunit II [Tsuneonella amylolytica]|uniref:cytochrome c oxidase subunit II n=1 Tax=Tsuneonella amylolytica TaxID=2338327 RepID=UPI000EA850E2|nr:cytochrome ubiquinol oxidase subunit II [Tsuneonella amylolytica]